MLLLSCLEGPEVEPGTFSTKSRHAIIVYRGWERDGGNEVVTRAGRKADWSREGSMSAES